MNTNRRHAVAALAAAGLLWGTTVPLSKLALVWLAPGWLTVLRFGLAAAVLLPVARRRGQRVLEARLLLSGAAGYGGSVIVQNAGITRTSVTHAALLIGAVPVLVAIIAAVWHRAVARPAAWLGFAISLGGVGLVTAGGGGGGASARGDALVLISLVLSATFTVAQGRLLPGRDPVAVTAVQFLGAALGALAFTLVTEGAPAVPAGPGSGAGGGRAGAGRDAGAVHAVRLRAEPGPAGDRRVVPQHRAAGRGPGRDRVLRRPGERGPAGRRAGRRGRASG